MPDRDRNMDDIINKQVEEHDKVGVCDCGCHTSPHSDADMKINGCDYCYEGSEYAPRHPDKRNVLVSSMKKVGEEIIKGFLVFDKTEKREKWVVMLEWNMDNPRELIEVHTWPIAIYKAGYRLKNDPRGEKARRIDELEFISLTEGE